MNIDDRIVRDYIAGKPMDSYRDHWLYSTLGNGVSFTPPEERDIPWVTKLHQKLLRQIATFAPRNGDTVRHLFPNFDRIAADYTIMLVVGFPDPYDANVLSHAGREYMVFDLIQFTQEALDDDYSCHGVLTHELIHLCLHELFPPKNNPTYVEDLNYLTFDEGFAHALSYPERIEGFCFDSLHEERFLSARGELIKALSQTDPERQQDFRRRGEVGEYWNKFASISGMLYLLKNREELPRIFKQGWEQFAERIVKA